MPESSVEDPDVVVETPNKDTASMVAVSATKTELHAAQPRSKGLKRRRVDPRLHEQLCASYSSTLVQCNSKGSRTTMPCQFSRAVPDTLEIVKDHDMDKCSL